MGIISRLLLLLYVLAVIAALVAGAGVCLHLIPAQVWQNELRWIISRQETLIVLAVMLLASFCLISVALSTRKSNKLLSSGDVELHRGESSEVHITIPATVSVVERAALSVIGVREANAKVYKQDSKVPIRIQLSIVLSQNYSAPDVSAEVRAAVNSALKITLQIAEVPIEIKVTEVTHAVIERERRVV